MDLKRKLLLSFSILIVVLALDYLFLHIIFPLKKERLLREANKEVELSLEMFPVDNLKKIGKPSENNLLEDSDFHTASQACTGLKWQSYETFPQELEKIYGIQARHEIPGEAADPASSQVSKERWLLGNGATLIITLKGNQIEELQLFGTDKTLSCVKESCQCR